MKKVSNNWTYANTPSNDARFLLGQQLKKSGPLLICIGINPSTAEPDALDATLSRVRNRALDLGYAGWLMLNVYSQRSTDPNGMDKLCNKVLHKKNLQEIKKELDKFPSDQRVDVWCAWGNLIDKRAYLRSCLGSLLALLTSYPQVRFLTFGPYTKKGNPHHPLWLRRDLNSEFFFIDSYLAPGGED